MSILFIQPGAWLYMRNLFVKLTSMRIPIDFNEGVFYNNHNFGDRIHVMYLMAIFLI